jgi:hypothetical protein
MIGLLLEDPQAARGSERSEDAMVKERSEKTKPDVTCLKPIALIKKARSPLGITRTLPWNNS